MEEVIKNFKTIVERQIPSKASLELLIERDLFQSEVFKELNLYPGPR